MVSVPRTITVSAKTARHLFVGIVVGWLVLLPAWYSAAEAAARTWTPSAAGQGVGPLIAFVWLAQLPRALAVPRNVISAIGRAVLVTTCCALLLIGVLYLVQ